ncbi:hypothetical protein BU15DRAFT_47122 [Melanogaster broomeanus]|nr:hypothetical protein BU15DRAFT_47122 [Melanogaster broomeanus]
MKNEDYWLAARQLEYKVVRAKQIHTCSRGRCLIPDKLGRYYCKRHAPFEISTDNEVGKDGRWRSKRSYGFLNGWMPSLSVNVRCNNDSKLLTNGGDTRNVSFYVTGYQTKKQGKSYNVSAVMARGYAQHLERQRNIFGEQQRLLLFRVVHAINREQELSAPMVISYLMGWGDTYRSHHYTPVYWSAFTQYLEAEFPSLYMRRNREETMNESGRDTTEKVESEVRMSAVNVKNLKMTLK